MKRTVCIFTSAMVLILMLLGISGVSVERCSCSGRVSLAFSWNGNCCDDESGCMMLKSMQLSDYLPSAHSTLAVPHQPLMSVTTPPVFPALSLVTWQHTESHCGQAPPDHLATTVAVLRV